MRFSLPVRARDKVCDRSAGCGHRFVVLHTLNQKGIGAIETLGFFVVLSLALLAASSFFVDSSRNLAQAQFALEKNAVRNNVLSMLSDSANCHRYFRKSGNDALLVRLGAPANWTLDFDSLQLSSSSDISYTNLARASSSSPDQRAMVQQGVSFRIRVGNMTTLQETATAWEMQAEFAMDLSTNGGDQNLFRSGLPMLMSFSKTTNQLTRCSLAGTWDSAIPNDEDTRNQLCDRLGCTPNPQVLTCGPNRILRAIATDGTPACLDKQARRAAPRRLVERFVTHRACPNAGQVTSEPTCTTLYARHDCDPARIGIRDGSCRPAICVQTNGDDNGTFTCNNSRL